MTPERGLRGRLGQTAAVEIVVALAAFWVLRLAARQLGPQGFGEYLAARRALSLLQLPLLLGLAIALPRYIAQLSHHASANAGARYVLAGLSAGLLPSAVVATFLALAPATSATLLLGDASLLALSPVLALCLVGLSAHMLTTAALRGRFAMGRANLLQLAVWGALPPAVFLLRPDGAEQALRWHGVAALVFAGGAAAWLMAWAIRAGALHAKPWTAAAELVRFGMTRVPGEFALVGLVSLPPLIALRSVGATGAGHLSFAMSVVTLFGAAFAPIGLVLLPTASRLSSMGDLEGLRTQARRLIRFGLPLALLGAVVGWPLAGPLTVWYLGPEFAPAIPLVRVMLLAAVPYAVYVLFRNLVDAIDVRAVNSRNLLVALACAMLPAIWWRSLIVLAGASAAGFVVVGLLTAVAVRRRLWPDSSAPSASRPSVPANS